MSKNLKVKAFTLLEALVALLVLSGGVLVFQAMTSSYLRTASAGKQSAARVAFVYRPTGDGAFAKSI